MPQDQDLMGFGMNPSLATLLGNNPQVITATGTTAGTAAKILSHLALVNAQSSQTGVILPSGAHLGTPFYVFGTGAVAPVVYPPTGGAINSAAASVTLSAAIAGAIFIRTSANQWYTVPLAP
jgi:hypothetical protein